MLVKFRLNLGEIAGFWSWAHFAPKLGHFRPEVRQKTPLKLGSKCTKNNTGYSTMNNVYFFQAIRCASEGFSSTKFTCLTRAWNSPNPTGFFPRAARPDRLFYFGHMDHTNDDQVINFFDFWLILASIWIWARILSWTWSFVYDNVSHSHDNVK